MNLIIRMPSLLLNKAGKQGLIAVQKQVTKKGKTFMQTFYVKPAEVKADPVIGDPLISVQTAKMPSTITLLRGDETFILESNRPEGGFFINSKGSGVAVRVPAKLIAKTFWFQGNQFVVHQMYVDGKWSSEFGVSEHSTGLLVSKDSASSEDAYTSAMSILESKKDTLNDVIDRQDKIKDLSETRLATDDDTVMAPTHELTVEEYRSAAQEMLEEYATDQSEYSKPTRDEIADWLSKHVKDSDDLSKLWDEIVDHPGSITSAVYENLEYEQAVQRGNALAEAYAILNEGTEVYVETYKKTMEAITAWARLHEDNLVDGLNLEQYEVDGDETGQDWTGDMVLAYAVSFDLSLWEAQNQAKEIVDDLKSEMSSDTLTEDIVDYYGKYWDDTDLRNIASWVGGEVRNSREATKISDNKRRSILIETKHKDLIQLTVEKQMSVFKGEEIYRGTSNEAWETAKVGQIVPLGMASFSHEKEKAAGFANGNTVIVLHAGGTDNPIMGVSVRDLIRAGDDQDQRGYISEIGLDQYIDEAEFIVRAPTMEIMSVEEHFEFIPPPGDAGKYVSENDRHVRLVHAKVSEMDLLDFLKSLFVDDDKASVEAMQETFNYGMSREPETWK